MALTRKMLKAMGVEEEKIDQIIEAHTETVDGLKADIEKITSAGKNAAALQKKVDELTAELEAVKDDGWKDKHDAVKKELDDLKKNVAAKETRAAKEKAVRAYLESKNITGANLTIAMRAIGSEIDASELDGEKLKDSKALDDLLAGDLKGLITTTTDGGGHEPPNPPKNTGGVKTREEIYKKDDKGRYLMDATERQRALTQIMANQS